MDVARTPAAMCRDLVARARFGALATLHAPRDGAASAPPDEDLWPFATLVAIAADARGRPLLLLSRLAEHTKNLERSPRASLLVSEPAGGADPLAATRLTIVGSCERVAEGDRVEAGAAFLAAHSTSSATMRFADFGLFRIEVRHVRWVAGFGSMGWVDGDDYVAPAAAALGAGPR